MAKITRAEFEAQYNNGDIKELVIDGALSIECECDFEECYGWKMTHLAHLTNGTFLYGNTPEEEATAIAHRLELIAQYDLEDTEPRKDE